MDFWKEFRFMITKAGFFLTQGGDDAFLKYGDIVILALGMYDADPDFSVTGNFRVDQDLQDLRGEIINDEISPAYKEFLAKCKELYDSKNYLKGIVSDREGFIRELPSKSSYLDNRISARFQFDSEKMESYAVYSASSITDLLFLDVCKVVETKTHIRKCPECNCYFHSKKKTARWCPSCRKTANAKAKQENMKKNRCSATHKKIADRLRRRCSINDAVKAAQRQDALNEYINQHNIRIDEYKLGIITEQALYGWLCKQDKATNRKPF